MKGTLQVCIQRLRLLLRPRRERLTTGQNSPDTQNPPERISPGLERGLPHTFDDCHKPSQGHCLCDTCLDRNTGICAGCTDGYQDYNDDYEDDGYDYDDGAQDHDSGHEVDSDHGMPSWLTPDDDAIHYDWDMPI